MSFRLQNSEVLARLKPFGILFEKSLGDLIKGIRSHLKISPDSLSTFLDLAIQECRTELSTTDMETKAMAVLKLTYLEMYGFDMTWCNFQILEVMSSSKFQQKRIGYLAAIQSFKNEQDLLILATNQFKKDLNLHNHFEIGLALSGIATIVTLNLSKDIVDDVCMKLTHSKPYIRKKAVLAMYKIFLQYPESLRVNFNRILEKLDDVDVSVVSATINVICEISKKSPSIFINYVPKFFTILEETKNNWLIIRILKLFQSLSKVEPRMKKKILPTIIELMNSTKASSLIYECINCIVSGNMLSSDSKKDKETATLCMQHIMTFYFDKPDSNLIFVGLIALVNIIKIFPSLIHKVKGVSQMIKDCITDRDIIIKSKALEVFHYLVNENNIAEVIRVLLEQLLPQTSTPSEIIPESLKLDITLKILSIASQDDYQNIPSFRWYVAVLKDMINLTLIPLPSASNPEISKATANIISKAIGQEFKTLAARVPSIRTRILTTVVYEMIQDEDIVDNCPIILKDFYWIMGEYIDDVKTTDDDDEAEYEDEEDDEEDDVEGLKMKVKMFDTLVNNYIDIRLHNSSDLLFPISSKLVHLEQSDVLIVLIQALVKLYSGIFTYYTTHYSYGGTINHDEFVYLSFYLHKLILFLGCLENHLHYEVQERALSWLEFLKLCLEALVGDDLREVKRLEEDEVKEYQEKLKSKEENDPESDEESEEESEENSEEDSDEESEEESEEVEEDEEEDDILKEKEGKREVPHGSEVTSFNEPNPFQETEELPILLSRILPSFFKSYDLNPISSDSQRNIPVPTGLDLSQRLNPPMFDQLSDLEDSDTDVSIFEGDENGYVEDNDEEPLIKLGSSSDDDLKRKERLERQKYDPYYITSSTSKKGKSSRAKTVSGDVTPSGTTPSDILSINSATGEDSNGASKSSKRKIKSKSSKLKKERVVILSEEKVAGDSEATAQNLIQSLDIAPKKKKKNTLRIDSSNLDNFDLNTPLSDEHQGKNDVASSSYDYDIDLNELRSKLENSSIKPKKKKLKKSIKDEDGKKKSSKKPKVKDGETQLDSVPPVALEGETEKSGSPESDVIAVKKTSKKKKKKAVIID